MKTALRGHGILLALAGLLVSARPAAGGEGLSVGKPSAVTPGLEKANQRWPAVAAGKDMYLVV